MSTLPEMIEKLIGDRSIRETSRDTDVAASYISGILKGNYMPSAEILSKLSVNAQNGITKEKLMIAAGYLDEGKESKKVMEKTIRDLCKEVARTGLLDTSEEAVIQYQDLIGHATEEENRTLSNDGALMESYYRIYGLAYGTVAAIKFYMKNSEKVTEMQSENIAAKLQIEDLEVMRKNASKAEDFWRNKAEEYKEKLEKANKDIELANKQIHLKDVAMVSLKARMYDLTVDIEELTQRLRERSE